MVNEPKLSKKHCVPCRVGVPPLKGKELHPYLKQLKRGWEIVDEHHLKKEYIFKDFVSALEFTNKVGQISEAEGHHPDIILTYGKVTLKLFTHKINGLSESDFILASKCDDLLL